MYVTKKLRPLFSPKTTQQIPMHVLDVYEEMLGGSPTHTNHPGECKRAHAKKKTPQRRQYHLGHLGK